MGGGGGWEVVLGVRLLETVRRLFMNGGELGAHSTRG